MSETKPSRRDRRRVALRVTLFEDGDPLAFAHFSTLPTMRARAFEARRLLASVLATPTGGMLAPPVAVAATGKAASPVEVGAGDGAADSRLVVTTTRESDTLGGLVFDFDASF